MFAYELTIVTLAVFCQQKLIIKSPRAPVKVTDGHLLAVIPQVVIQILFQEKGPSTVSKLASEWWVI